MTRKQILAERDRLAEKYWNDDDSASAGDEIPFKAGFTTALELMERGRVRPLREALRAWLKFEEAQIKKEGPYVGQVINELIQQGEHVLAAVPEWEKE